MNEQELASKIVQHLEQGLGHLKQGTLYQLQSARKAALDRYREAPQPAFGLEWRCGGYRGNEAQAQNYCDERFNHASKPLSR